MSNHVLLAALAAALVLTQAAFGDATWVGDTSQDWNNAANWSSDPSNPSGNFFINTAVAGVFPIVAATPSFTPVDIFVGNGSGITGRVDHTAGTLATGTDNWFFVGSNTGTGTYNVANTAGTGGTLTGFGTGSANASVGKLRVGGSPYQGSGTGVVNINTSGTVNAYANNNIGGLASISLGTTSTGNGTINLDNGTLSAGGEIWVGHEGTGTLNQAGGTTSSYSYFVVGRYSGSHGYFNLSGGQVNASTNANTHTTIGADAGAAGTVSISGGTFTENSEFWVGESGKGTVNQTGGTISSGTYFVVGFNNGSVGVFDLSGGTVNGATNNGFTVMGSNAGSSGTLNVSGNGVLNSPREMRIGEKGTGTLNQTGGTVSVGGVTYVGYGESDTSTQSGTLTVSGGTFTSEGDIELGHAGSSTAQASLTIKNGGVVNVASTITRWMIIGRGGSACNSTLTVNNGGTLNLNAGTDLRVSEGGGSGTNVINVDGGTIQGSVGTFLKGGNSTSTITIQNGGGILGVTDGHDSWDGKTIVKSGGVLETKYVAGGSGTAGSGLYIDGGTVRATAAETGFINYWGGISEAYISAGGATIDNAGYDVTITGNDNGLLADPGSAGGGVTFTGTGTTTLAQANTYTGRTDVDAGTLALTGSGSIANSAVIDVAKDATLDVSALSGWAVGSGQKLEGNGTVDANDGTTMDTVTVNGTLAPGNSIGTLIIDGNLELAGTAEFEIDPDPNPVLADLADVTGLLTYGGTLNVSTLAGSSGAYAWGDTFNLFDFTSYSGTFTGGVSLPPLSGGLVWDQTKLYSEGLITVVPEPATTLGLALLLSGALLRRSRKAES